MEEAEREEEEEEEEESPKELEPEKEEIGVRLNSKKMGDGSAVSHSTRSQLQRRCVFLGGYSVFNEH